MAAFLYLRTRYERENVYLICGGCVHLQHKLTLTEKCQIFFNLDVPCCIQSCPLLSKEIQILYTLCPWASASSVNACTFLYALESFSLFCWSHVIADSSVIVPLIPPAHLLRWIFPRIDWLSSCFPCCKTLC